MVRKYTDKLLEMVEDMILDKDNVILACVKYLSEDDVKDMMEKNEFICPCHGESYCEGE
tara:strand:- start:203 stop:379 length:177 start_codon:yes stop_codon:yes gene_type:complete